jgi:hypothetical protein
VLTVTANAAPIPVINLPVTGAKFVAGRAVSFSGSATDPEDGAVPASRLTWAVSYVTAGIARPFVNAFSGQTTGTFTPSVSTPYLGTDVAYRISLTATDSQGRSTTVTRDLAPTVVNLQLASNIAGLKLNLDGNPLTAPATRASVAGLRRQLSAPPSQVLNGITYDFVRWSDGGTATHDISVPTSPITYTATYQRRTVQTSTQALLPVADTWVSQMAPATAYGSAGVLDVRRSSSVYARAAYLTFDLSSAGSISQATLKLFGKLDKDGSVSVAAYRVSQTNWPESTTVWNNRPALGSQIGSAQVVNSTVGRTYSFDLTSYLQAEKAAGRNRVTIGLFGTAATSPIARFNSREAAANRPVLEVM